MFVINGEDKWEDFEALYNKQNSDDLTMTDIVSATRLLKHAVPIRVSPSDGSKFSVSLFDVFFDFLENMKLGMEKATPFPVPIHPEFYLTDNTSMIGGRDLLKQVNRFNGLSKYFSDKMPPGKSISSIFDILQPTSVREIKYLISLVYVATRLYRN